MLQVPATSFQAANITEWRLIVKRIAATFGQALQDTRSWW